MSSVKLQVLLKAVDQATRPLKSIDKASKELAGGMRTTQTALRELNGQASKIDGFRKTRAQLAVTEQALKKAKDEAAALAIQFKNTEQPTRAQAQAMETARKSAAALQLKHNSLRESVQRQRQELSLAGINTRTLAADERKLKATISETTSQINRQREALARVSAQQEKLSRVKQRYQAGKELAGNAAAVGAAGAGMATTATLAGAALLKPGYDFAQKNSELQAVLGVGKDSAEMTALRRQARQLGDNTAASADDAAGAQIIIAKGGGDAAAIQAVTPVTLNMALANRRTMEENAGLLMGMKSAFQLSNDKVAHIGDVLSMTMNKTAADFDGLSDALTYAAPVAKNAGVSIEQAAAMVGALHDAKITGSMAGTGSRAVITRLQAPTGEAYRAIKELGITTADKKGNTRPIFAILKEMQASFEKNRLGTGQRAEYLKTIFGEEASSSAAVLMAAASGGKLDALTAAFKASDGKTEELVNVMQDNLGGDFKEFQSAYEAVGTDLFDQQESSLRKLVQTATGYVLKLDNWIAKNKGLAQTLGVIAAVAVGVVGLVGAVGLVAWPVITGINAIIAIAGVLGTVFSVVGGAIMTVLGALTWPIVAIGVAIVAGALLIRKYWEPISAFFSGVVEGLTAAFAPVAEIFAPLKPVFDWLGGKLKAVWDWFTNLIGPVKSTQDTLNACRDTGVLFGQALADALLMPLTAFNKLKQGIDWVLDKLGLINKESSDLDQKAVKAGAAAQSGSYIPATSTYGGYQGYQPAVAPGGKSYVDNRQSHYNITMQNGGAPGGELGRQLQDAVEKADREKRARERSSMRHDG
ncbi:UNVERIFIED_ORG: TP901 family phage tail tape measure protein [Kosakonia oryzae]|uniref:Phage tail tape measure protein, TP901 family, core region n=1 Tax=Kosakonia radicincitans TaxID=283686 RepID=A0AAX2EZX5_9ENTR|nr:phage tail tape measure protein [Kosakonia radicincitans]MDP9569447.1 TP901 family phage tail tape measure protein [Kosakonia oryzae]SFF42975.1 phage tail tape measure protein, TP901 family, core region [Kosakonia radicincitans]SFR27223.1 phage tail tape measure protein, TP901 family, core region [Kosakonia radicincitans]SFU18605.1 phage tail tape measure protein, TP901 family, core region [Kosakonia radicincitans]SFY35853.1 phage tail tape measure protein, TP901 family, core region [Kosako